MDSEGIIAMLNQIYVFGKSLSDSGKILTVSIGVSQLTLSKGVAYG